MQFGTELDYSSGGEPRERGRLLQRPWAHWQFFAGQPGMLLLSQAGSDKILCAELPLQGAASRDVFMFGQHSGRRLLAKTFCSFPCWITSDA